MMAAFNLIRTGLNVFGDFVRIYNILAVDVEYYFSSLFSSRISLLKEFFT
jgi:hypothetical protein